MWGQDQGGSGRGMREPLAGGGADDPQLASINDMMGSLDDAQLRYLQSLTEAQIRDAIHDMGFEIPASMVPQLIVNARAMLADRARDNAPADEPPPRGSPPSDGHGRSVQDYYNDGGHGSHRDDGGHKSGRDSHREDDDSYDEPPRHAPPPAARPSHDRAALDQLRELMEDPGESGKDRSIVGETDRRRRSTDASNRRSSSSSLREGSLSSRRGAATTTRVPRRPLTRRRPPPAAPCPATAPAPATARRPLPPSLATGAQ